VGCADSSAFAQECIVHQEIGVFVIRNTIIVVSLLAFIFPASSHAQVQAAPVFVMILKEISKATLTAVASEGVKSAIDYFKTRFNKDKKIADNFGKPQLTKGKIVNKKRVWSLSPTGSLKKEDIYELAKALKSIDNNIDQKISARIGNNNRIIISTQGGKVVVGNDTTNINISGKDNAAYIGSVGQSGGVTTYQVIQSGPSFDPLHPLSVTPSSRQVGVGTGQDVFKLKVTNHSDTPFFQIQLRIKIEEEDLSLDQVAVRAMEDSGISMSGDNLKLSANMFAVTFCDSGEKLTEKVQYIYDIGARSERNFEVSINRDNHKKPSKVLFEIGDYSKEPAAAGTSEKGVYMGFTTPDWKQNNESCSDKDDFQRTYEKGNKLLNNGAFREAEECYKRAIKLDPTSVKAHTNLGNTYYSSGQKDSAVLEWNTAIKLGPDAPQPQFNLGLLLMEKNRL
jgi:hypothetical protein